MWSAAECQSKFMFGRMLAREFGFDENLVLPGLVRDSEMKAPRSPLLSLSSEKLARALGQASARAAAMPWRRYAGAIPPGISAVSACPFCSIGSFSSHG